MNKDYEINGKIVGSLNEDTYVSHRKSLVHYYVKGGGYPISNSILKDLKQNGCKHIIIIEERANGQKKVYKTDIERYQKAVLIQEPNYDQQRCLPLKEMESI